MFDTPKSRSLKPWMIWFPAAVVWVSTQRNGGHVSNGAAFGVVKKPDVPGQRGDVSNRFAAYDGRWQPAAISSLRFGKTGSQSMSARWLEPLPRLSAIGGSSWSRAMPPARPMSRK